jgi:hypothetical protein
MSKTYTYPIIDNSDGILDKLKKIESFAYMFRFTKYNKKKFDKQFDTKIFCEWFVDKGCERYGEESEFFDSFVNGFKVFLDYIANNYGIEVCYEFYEKIYHPLNDIEIDIYNISIFEESDLHTIRFSYNFEKFENEVKTRIQKIQNVMLKDYKNCLNKLEKEMYKFAIVFEKAIEEIRKIGIDNLQKTCINVREQELLIKKKEIEDELNKLKNGNIVKTVKKPVAKKCAVAKKPCKVIRKK